MMHLLSIEYKHTIPYAYGNKHPFTHDKHDYPEAHADTAAAESGGKDFSVNKDYMKLFRIYRAY